MRHKYGLLALSAALVLGLGQPLTASAEQGDWILRSGLIVVDPKSDNYRVPGSGERVELDTAVGASIEATYMFANHWGVELFTTAPVRHDYELKGTGGKVDVARSTQIMPTLSLQYHFNPEGTWRPYIGGGLNFTKFFRTEPTMAIAPISRAHMNNTWGLAGQLGLDVGVTDNLFVNAAVRYIDTDTHAQADGVDLGRFRIDPLVYQLQLGYRFGKTAAAPEPVQTAAPAPAPKPVPPPPPAPPADSDGDGVPDSQDLCPDTPKGDRVDAQGCSCDVTRQVQFAHDSAQLTDEGRKTLDELADTLVRLKFVSGTVVGHTDSVGAAAYNQKLSERRAQSVVDYLHSKGIGDGRLAASGAGESQPIADNKTAEGRALNRRVVLSRTDCR